MQIKHHCIKENVVVASVRTQMLIIAYFQQ